MPEKDEAVKTAHRYSSGGVLIKTGQGKPKVCLIKPLGTDHWQLPKGIIEEGETAKVTATREIEEETGCRGRLREFLDKIEYWFYRNSRNRKIRVHKTVKFYLFIYLDGDTENKDANEIEEARWFPLNKGKELLTYANERQVLEKAVKALGAES